MQSIFRNYISAVQEANKNFKTNFVRTNIKPGLLVDIVEKHNQKSGILTRGIVKSLLTSKPTHTRGIKVRLITGQVGRVQHIIGPKKK